MYVLGTELSKYTCIFRKADLQLSDRTDRWKCILQCIFMVGHETATFFKEVKLRHRLHTRTCSDTSPERQCPTLGHSANTKTLCLGIIAVWTLPTDA